jgi:hypothetical protein
VGHPDESQSGGKETRRSARHERKNLKISSGGIEGLAHFHHEIAGGKAAPTVSAARL